MDLLLGYVYFIHSFVKRHHVDFQKGYDPFFAVWALGAFAVGFSYLINYLENLALQVSNPWPVLK